MKCLKRIFINARFLTQSITGVQRYAIELVKAIDALIDSGVIDNKKYSFCLLAPRDTKYELSLKHISLKRVGKLKGHFWEQLEIPFFAQTGLLINLCNTGPILKLNQIVTIHDAGVYGFSKAYSFPFRIWYKLLLNILVKLSKKVLTNSFFSKAELIKYLGVKQDNLRVTYLGKEHILAIDPDESILSSHKLKSNQYILAVSSMNPNKNFGSIIKAIKLLKKESFDIVIAGGMNPKIFGNSTMPFPDNVKYVGNVSDAELRALYEHASCFVYPSYYEGFGLPPLEAMSLGCPVIVSNTTSLPEVCREAALYCNPSDPQDIANKIQSIMETPKLRGDLREKSLQQIRYFSWNNCAEETWSVIKGVLEE